MKSLSILVGLALFILVGCKEEESSPAPTLVSEGEAVETVISDPTKAKTVKRSVENTTDELNYDPADAESFSKAFFEALRKEDAKEAASFWIEYDREHVLETFSDIKNLPPVPEAPDLWVREYAGKDAGRVSARNWEADVTFNLIFREGRWWFARSN